MPSHKQEGRSLSPLARLETHQFYHLQPEHKIEGNDFNSNVMGFTASGNFVQFTKILTHIFAVKYFEDFTKMKVG